MRRVAIALLFALILLAPFVSAEAQQPPIYWLGYLSRSGSGPNPFVDQFVQELRTRGWVDGQNLVTEYRWAGGKIVQRHRAFVGDEADRRTACGEPTGSVSVDRECMPWDIAEVGPR